MSFLEINGYTIPVEINNPDKSYNRKRFSGRSPTGQYKSNQRYKKNQWELDTTILTNSKAKAVKGLLEGEGHYFSFDSNIKSSKGLLPDTGYDVNMVSSGGKYNGYISIDSSSGSISYDIGYTGDWTVMLYADLEENDKYTFYSTYFPVLIDTGDLNWNQYVLTSSGNKYFNGSEITTDDIDFSFIDMTSGTLTLQDTSDWNYDIDEMVVFPFELTSQMASSFYNYSNQFSSLPQLKITGDMTNNRNLTVYGTVNQRPFQQFRNNNGWQNDGQKVNFTLRQA
jgi:hypothetical protein